MTLGCGCCETQRKKTVAEQHARGDIMEGYENMYSHFGPTGLPPLSRSRLSSILIPLDCAFTSPLACLGSKNLVIYRRCSEVEGDCSWCLETTTHSIQK